MARQGDCGKWYDAQSGGDGAETSKFPCRPSL